MEATRGTLFFERDGEEKTEKKREKLFRFFFSSRVSERKVVEGVSSGSSRKAN